MNPVVVGAIITAIASLIAALIVRSRASTKADATQQASPTIHINQSQQRSRSRSQASSFFLGVAAACLAVVAIVVYATDDADSGEESGQTRTDDSVETSEPALPPSSAPDSTMGAPISSDAAACPDEQQFTDAQAAPDAEFSYRVLPRPQASIVLQVSVEKERAGGSEIIVTICQDDSGSYWYFSRWLARPTIGLVTPASRGDAGFDATYDFDEGDIALYQVRPTEVVVSSAGTIQHLAVVETFCVDPDNVPEVFSGSTAESCTEATVSPWAF